MILDLNHKQEAVSNKPEVAGISHTDKKNQMIPAKFPFLPANMWGLKSGWLQPNGLKSKKRKRKCRSEEKSLIKRRNTEQQTKEFEESLEKRGEMGKQD